MKRAAVWPLLCGKLVVYLRWFHRREATTLEVDETGNFGAVIVGYLFVVFLFFDVGVVV